MRRVERDAATARMITSKVPTAAVNNRRRGADDYR